MDLVDTSYLLSVKYEYLPVVIYKDDGKVLYRVYETKDSFLDDKYSVISINENGACEVYENNPWVIYDKKQPVFGC
ncbi:MAG: hypothetical protein XXXJIFNMEKO3_02671 [Candidatus Erwinia impunctatus]|nr:hypothetical protein XXXJIFNMEKO_02671 [Culicoides impunctatus]